MADDEEPRDGSLVPLDEEEASLERTDSGNAPTPLDHSDHDELLSRALTQNLARKIADSKDPEEAKGWMELRQQEERGAIERYKERTEFSLRFVFAFLCLMGGAAAFAVGQPEAGGLLFGLVVPILYGKSVSGDADS